MTTLDPAGIVCGGYPKDLVSQGLANEYRVAFRWSLAELTLHRAGVDELSD